MNPGEHLPLAPRDYVILLALSRGPAHGYGIMKAADGEGTGGVRLDPANLYRALRRLDRDGLVEEREPDDPPEPEGADRRYYALTELGLAVVKAEAARLARLTDRARAWRLIPDTERGR